MMIDESKNVGKMAISSYKTSGGDTWHAKGRGEESVSPVYVCINCVFVVTWFIQKVVVSGGQRG